ncbi:MAG TPA: hypothetical protein PLW01_03895 [Agitococcus sp.]|nr:hypothetical protein [Agitococcus sp.]
MNDIPKELLGKVWHTTTLQSFLSIYKMGFISKDIDNSLIWHKIHNNAAVKSNKTYVQSLGGVSVFDFVDFCYKSYYKIVENHYLFKFIPFDKRRDNQKYGIWIAIDTDKCVNYINREDLYLKWKTEGEKNGYNFKFYPKVEATIIGNIPFDAIQCVYLYDSESKKYHKIDVCNSTEMKNLEILSIQEMA